MTQNSLRRTVRRAAAVLLIPLSVLVVQLSIHLRKTAGLVDSGAVSAAELAGYALVAASVLYLVGSSVAAVYDSFRTTTEEG